MEIDRKQIAKILEDKGATNACHRCGCKQFTVLEGYSNVSLQEDLERVFLGGPSIPVAMIACTNCGAITFHALGALGMLPQEKESK